MNNGIYKDATDATSKIVWVINNENAYPFTVDDPSRISAGKWKDIYDFAHIVMTPIPAESVELGECLYSAK